MPKQDVCCQDAEAPSHWLCVAPYLRSISIRLHKFPVGLEFAARECLLPAKNLWQQEIAESQCWEQRCIPPSPMSWPLTYGPFDDAADARFS